VLLTNPQKYYREFQNRDWLPSDENIPANSAVARVPVPVLTFAQGSSGHPGKIGQARESAGIPDEKWGFPEQSCLALLLQSLKPFQADIPEV
jgi:hypothetical protein